MYKEDLALYNLQGLMCQTQKSTDHKLFCECLIESTLELFNDKI